MSSSLNQGVSGDLAVFDDQTHASVLGQNLSSRDRIPSRAVSEYLTRQFPFPACECVFRSDTPDASLRVRTLGVPDNDHALDSFAHHYSSNQSPAGPFLQGKSRSIPFPGLGGGVSSRWIVNAAESVDLGEYAAIERGEFKTVLVGWERVYHASAFGLLVEFAYNSREFVVAASLARALDFSFNVDLAERHFHCSQTQPGPIAE